MLFTDKEGLIKAIFTVYSGLILITDSSKLKKGQLLKVDLSNLNDRLPLDLLTKLRKDPLGKLIGYKMVDGNQFGLVLKLNIGVTQWFFEQELIEIN